MQTLTDPFELASRQQAQDELATLADEDVEIDQAPSIRESALPLSPDSSARLRCWCSED